MDSELLTENGQLTDNRRTADGIVPATFDLFVRPQSANIAHTMLYKFHEQPKLRTPAQRWKTFVLLFNVKNVTYNTQVPRFSEGG